MTENIATALLAALAEMPNPTKSATAKGAKFSYNYETLADVLAIVKPALAKHGLLLRQAVIANQGGPRDMLYTAVVLAETGEEMALDAMPLTIPEDPQAAGSAITYARRYALKTAFGLAGEDDDGQAASAYTQSLSPKAQAETKAALARKMADLWKQATAEGLNTDHLRALIWNATSKDASAEFTPEDYRAAIGILQEALK